MYGTASTMDSSAPSTAANPFSTRIHVAPAYVRLLSSNFRSSRPVRASLTIWERGHDTGSEECRARVASVLGLAGTAYKRNTNHSPNTPHVMRTCRGCDAGADGARSERWARKSALWAVDRSDSCRVFAHAEYSYDRGATRYSAARDHAAVLRSSSTSVACCRERSAGGLGTK